jgi:hypothetical protein
MKFGCRGSAVTDRACLLGGKWSGCAALTVTADPEVHARPEGFVRSTTIGYFQLSQSTEIETISMEIVANSWAYFERIVSL